jgi:hypothetical protein
MKPKIGLAVVIKKCQSNAVLHLQSSIALFMYSGFSVSAFQRSVPISHALHLYPLAPPSPCPPSNDLIIVGPFQKSLLFPAGWVGPCGKGKGRRQIITAKQVRQGVDQLLGAKMDGEPSSPIVPDGP